MRSMRKYVAALVLALVMLFGSAGVALAGWPPDLPDEEVLKSLLALNQERSGGD